MAMLTIEGWETGTAKSGWSVDFTRAATTTGRFGGSALQSAGTGTTTTEYTVPGNPTTIVTGAAFKPPAGLTGSNSRLFWIIGSDSTQHLFTNLGAGGVVQLYRGGSPGTSSSATLIATSSTAVTYDAWNFLELKATIHDTTGSVIIELNGTEIINFTGDTRNAGTGNLIGLLAFGIGNATTVRMPLDDIYVLDGTGAAPHNDFLGDVKVETLVPNGNGTHSQLLGSDGNSTDNYLLVDELPASVTDYVGSATVGQRDTYAMTNLATASGQVFAVQTSALAYKTDAGSANFNLIERTSGGTERETGPTALTASPGAWVTTGPKVTDPEGGVWSITSVNAAEFGAEVA